jgi:tRNA pseudouridine38-40 synthase
VTARRIALLVEYEGTAYGGSQLQKNTPSIQGDLERAIERLTGQRARVAFAGRTDAGVHALNQVAAFTTETRHSPTVLHRGLNALLPESIAIKHAAEVDASFDPRRHAAARVYRYLVRNTLVRSPFWRTRAWHVPRALDLEAMQQAAALLVGEHDFAAFSRREGVTTRRHVYRCEVSRDGRLVKVEMEANAFLRGQVRRTIGLLVQVGLGKRPPDDVSQVLRKAQPASAGPVAPAHGLYLVHVAYPALDLEAQIR